MWFESPSFLEEHYLMGSIHDFVQVRFDEHINSLNETKENNESRLILLDVCSTCSFQEQNGFLLKNPFFFKIL